MRENLTVGRPIPPANFPQAAGNGLTHGAGSGGLSVNIKPDQIICIKWNIAHGL